MRQLFAKLLTISVLVAPVSAHDGAHIPKVFIKIEQAEALGDHVLLAARLTSLEGALNLAAITVDGAQVDLGSPDKLRFGQDVHVSAMIQFDVPAPGIFTALFDFGEDGQGPVTVIPTF